jgi:hypothetical protein
LCLPASIFASLVSLRSALILCPIIDDLFLEGLSFWATVANEPERAYSSGADVRSHSKTLIYPWFSFIVFCSVR